jgi:uncharacterized protein HemY
LKNFFENVTIIRENFERKSKEHEKQISNQLNSIKNSVDDVNSSKKIIVEDYFKQETPEVETTTEQVKQEEEHKIQQEEEEQVKETHQSEIQQVENQETETHSQE